MIIDRLPPFPFVPASGDEIAIERGVNVYKIDYDALAAAIIAQYTKNNLITTTPGYALDARQGKTLNDAIAATQSDIAIIIDGNQTTHTGGASVGKYVIVRNSTISGITDGLYKAVQSIPTNTAITSAYLAAVSEGGLNELNGNLRWKSASSFSQAFSEAITEIALIGRGTTYSNANVCLTLIIPKISITNTNTTFMVSDSYNGGTDYHLQAVINSGGGAINVGLYEGRETINNQQLQWLYR